MSMDLVIDREFKELIPPLTPEERAGLEKSLIEEGCRDALIVWNGVIVDGHNRYEICKEYGIEFKTIEKKFPDKDAAKVWIIENQFSRRNLPIYVRGELMLKLKPLISAKAKENLVTHTKNGYKQLCQNSDNPVDTKKELSKLAGVSHDTISRIEKIAKKAPDDVKTKLRAGEMSINEAYKKVKQIETTEKKKELVEKYKAEAGTCGATERIKIVHDDCINFLKAEKSDSYDLIIADPPYFEIVKDSWDNAWNDKSEYLAWCERWMIEALRVLKPTGSFYIWGGVGEKGATIIEQKLLLDRIGFYFKDWITWKKQRGMGNRKGWLYTREELLWYVKDDSQFIWNEEEQYSDEPNQFKKGFTGYECKSEYKRISNVWTDIPEQLSGKELAHYTPKPIKAIERIIKAHTFENQIVLDFFGGSGTTGVACKNLSRRCVLVEKEEESVSEMKVRIYG
jgi:DNA modification methylase